MSKENFFPLRETEKEVERYSPTREERRLSNILSRDFRLPIREESVDELSRLYEESQREEFDISRLPPKPSYLERTRLVGGRDIITLIERKLKDYISEDNVADYQWNPEKNKLEGITLDPQGIAHFKINLFRNEVTNEVTYEFQRMSGSRSAFYDLFSYFRGDDRKKLPGPETFINTIDEEGARMLLDTAKSEYFGISRDSIITLASYIRDRGNREIIMKNSSPGELISICASAIDSRELRIYVYRMLVDLSSEPSMYKDMSNFILSRERDLRNILGQPYDYMLEDVKRSIVKIMTNISLRNISLFRDIRRLAAENNDSLLTLLARKAL